MIDLDKRSQLRFFGTEGSGHQIKCWFEQGGAKYLIKLNSKYREATKEVDASVLLRAGGLDVVQYTAERFIYKSVERIGCVCKSFLGDNEYSMSLNSIIEDIIVTNNESALDYFTKTVVAVSERLHINYSDVYTYMVTILTADYLMMNPDRHLKNIEFICSSNGIWRPSPLFDFGQSFLKRDGISSTKQFIAEERKFKSLPFSRSPERNLIDIQLAKQIASNILNNIGDINSLKINQFHKKVFAYRAKKLLSL